ncbi:hypothetical protein Q2T41_15925 [Maribacter confluentis]|uniref:Uncharacterized protein n=1 Tax=Maribacter confluentis TaxID=1656093 RepID=A0ABT8RTB8_9FLAO|nr:hypothetical protein [Maribacter confluentis]MDO1514149.1 hypothetical protein [Maribacter confluentis]
MKKSFYIVAILFVIVGCKHSTHDTPPALTKISLLPYNKVIAAGEPFQLRFKGNLDHRLKLVVRNSLGITVLTPKINNDQFLFDFPKHLIRKSGICHWSLVHNAKVLNEGAFDITPNTALKTHIESYLGPRSITAVATDFSMHVISPTDAYDNPLSQGTEVISTFQFQDKINTTTLEINNLLAWTSIYAPTQAGRILVTSSCNASSSKELTTIVYPGNGTNFKIDFQRNHSFADGNQIITFFTSDIKDVNNNVISDGTLVHFLATNSKGLQLSANGTTLNGVANARFLHPNEEDTWSVKAYITGAAVSSPLNVSFTAAIKDYDITPSKTGRTITVENILSFMDQIVPDGLPVTLQLYDEQGVYITIIRETSRLGKIGFALPQEYFKSGNYKIKANVAGIVKEQMITLE